MTSVGEESGFPKSFGSLLYHQFEALDIAGPLEALNVLARSKGFEEMRLSLISKTIEPISVGQIPPGHNGSQIPWPTALYANTYI